MTEKEKQQAGELYNGNDRQLTAERIAAKKLCADMISLSGHKIYAPKGIGALYLTSKIHLPPLLLGGGQEKGFRSGTESVPLICGFGAAVKALSGRVDENFKNDTDKKVPDNNICKPSRVSNRKCCCILLKRKISSCQAAQPAQRARKAR